MFPVFSAFWFNSGYMLRQFTEAFGIISHAFYVKVGLHVLDPRISAQCLVRQWILAHASDYGGFYGSHCRKLRKFRSCSFLKVIDISFMVQRQISMVLLFSRPW